MSVDPEQTPANGGSVAPETQPEPPQIDWEQRYKDTHSWGNTAHETLKDPQKILEYIQANHPDLIAEDDDEFEEFQPTPTTGNESEHELARRLDEFEEWKQSQETAQATNKRQAAWDGWEQHVKEQAKTQGFDLSARDIKALKLDCVDSNGYPVPPEKANEVVKTHVDDVTAWLDEQVSTRSKRPRVPHTVTSGGEPGGPKDPADMSPEEKRDHALALLRAQDG